MALVDRLVADKLTAEAETIRAEGWKWIEVAPDFAYGHAFGLRQLRGETVAADGRGGSDPRRAPGRISTGIGRTMQDADELPDEVDERLSEIETALEGFETRPVVSIRPRSRALAPSSASTPTGTFASSVAMSGPRTSCRSSRSPICRRGCTDRTSQANHRRRWRRETIVGRPAEPAAEPEEDEGLSPIPDRLMTELTSHRTLAFAMRWASARTSRSSRHYTPSR